VLVFHAAVDTGATRGGPWGWALARLDVGVAVFFVLSGFLLYRPFVLAHLRGEQFPSMNAYARNRFLRIYPAWWVVLAVVGWGFGRIAVDDGRDVAYYVSLLIGFDPPQLVSNGLSQAWTLTIEITFYAFLPVLCFGLWRGVRGPVERRLLAHAVAVGGLYAFGLVARAAFALARPGHPALIWLPTQVDLFALGMGVALVSAWDEVRGRAGRVASFVAARSGWLYAGAGVAFWALAVLADLPRHGTLDPLDPAQELRRHFLFGVIALLLLLPGVFGRARLARLRVFGGLGAVSYGLYLWHADVLLALVGPRGPLAGAAEHRFLLLLAVGLPVSLALATASYWLVERPALRLKARPVSRASSPSGGPAGA
jgi:peptidoglycan/LPS O-acetylase OafA/YrhL